MKFSDYKHDIEDYFRKNGLKVDPTPHVVFDWSKNDPLDPFISTGKYYHNVNTIVLHVSNRQLKDILRTFAHELVHCSQYHENPDTYIESAGNTILENKGTEDIEAEAYKIGNVLFRKWTESKNDSK